LVDERLKLVHGDTLLESESDKFRNRSRKNPLSVGELDDCVARFACEEWTDNFSGNLQSV
jgi:hypothetical protein